MNRVISGFFWVSLYLIVVLAPILLMLVPPIPSGRAFIVELSVAFGFVGLTQIAVQFVLIARFKRLTAPYGIDIILQYHRKIALVAVALILAHPLLLLIEHPARIMLFNPFGGTWASRMGLLAIFALLVIVVTSIWREELRLNYERWRVAHTLLGIIALAAAQAHVSLAGLYINTDWKQAIWIGSSVIMLSLIAYLRLVKPARQRNKPYRVIGVQEEKGDSYTLSIAPDGHEGMRFEPGQFAWIKVGDSPWSIDEHPFSFASSAERHDRLSFGIKRLGDFTNAVAEVEPGTPVYLDGPHGAFSIDRFQAPGYVFVVGGIGITPVMSFLHTMADRADPRPIMLIYGGADEESLTYSDEIERMKEKLDLEVVYVLEEPPSDWQHEEGFVTGELLDRRLPKEKITRSFFVCGPPVMMEAVEEALLEHGVPREHLHMEKFELA
ncbi:ferredoxin reductase family protein [soil metagenome]